MPLLAIQLLPVLARAIASEFIDDEQILKWISAAGAVVVAGVNVETGLGDLVTQMETMVAEGRNPTEDEWSAIKARKEAADKIISEWRPGI